MSMVVVVVAVGMVIEGGEEVVVRGVGEITGIWVEGASPMSQS